MDKKFIRRCIELAENALDKGENPFAALIVKDSRIIAKSENMVIRNKDVTQHAETLVMQEAQRILGRNDLSDCVIYSNCEPCAMCAFMIRELKFKKVVFSVKSPDMGGYSRWRILQDENLEKLKPYFIKPPKIIAYLLREEGEKTFDRKSKLASKN